MRSILGTWVSRVLGGFVGWLSLIAAYSLAVCFFVYALYGILRAILTKRASGDAIFGLICGYLLLGIIWSVLYCAVETASPGSFAAAGAKDVNAATEPMDRGVLNYYSFITLATVGYGDVTPTTPLARTLAWTEAITGQFYLAVLVAGLVGLKVSQAMRK